MIYNLFFFFTFRLWLGVSNLKIPTNHIYICVFPYIYIYIYIHTHTHTHHYDFLLCNRLCMSFYSTRICPKTCQSLANVLSILHLDFMLLVYTLLYCWPSLEVWLLPFVRLSPVYIYFRKITQASLRASKYMYIMFT